MSFFDDDVPAHVDRCDCGMINPQARRLLRLQAGRTTPQGLNDRIFVPKNRRPAPMAPHELTTWQ